MLEKCEIKDEILKLRDRLCFIHIRRFPSFQPPSIESLRPRNHQFPTLEPVHDPRQEPQELTMNIKNLYKYIFMIANTLWGRVLSAFLAASRNPATPFSSSQIKRDSPTCLKVIFTCCWNTSYQLCQGLSRWIHNSSYHILSNNSPQILSRFFHFLCILRKVFNQNKYHFHQIGNNLFQSPGFALVIDRRRGSWQEVQLEFDKIITLFPAKIKEVFLLYQYSEGRNFHSYKKSLSRTKKPQVTSINWNS